MRLCSLPEIRFRSRLVTLVFATIIGTSTCRAAETPLVPYLLQMIRDDAVHKELGLTPSQVDEVVRSLQPIDARWWPSRILPVDRQRSEVTQLLDLMRGELDRILTESQRQRVLELERQAHGTRMVLRDDVMASLDITPKQASSLTSAFEKTDSDTAALQSQVLDKSLTQESAAKKVQAIRQREREQVASTLTNEQKSKIGSLVGESFDFASVRRTYPLAPDFVATGSTWIGGQPDGSPSLADGTVTMSSLRGDVVVVFFYAFQCINCQRNFPHYKAWQDELASKGVKIIGIQTPETSAEKSLERVSQAHQSDGFQFPVLFDENSGNWRAWGNTMWPTTYLIDKKGFIRRWWQGEMDWKGTPGHMQMRQTILELLAEK